MAPAAPLQHTESGTGAPLILVHGWTAGSRVWEPLARHLSTSYRVLAPDLPGHGATPMRGSGHRFNDECAEALVEWAHAVGVPRAPIVAWAQGARVVIDATARNLIAPASMLLVAVPPPADVPDPYSGPLWRDHARYIRTIVRMMTADPTSPEREAWLTDLMTSASIAAAGGAHAQPWEPAEDVRLPAGSVAILGGQDRIGSTEPAAALLSAWGAHVEVWPDVGHLPFIEQADRFQERTLAWLTDIERTPA